MTNKKITETDIDGNEFDPTTVDWDEAIDSIKKKIKSLKKDGLDTARAEKRLANATSFKKKYS